MPETSEPTEQEPAGGPGFEYENRPVRDILFTVFFLLLVGLTLGFGIYAGVNKYVFDPRHRKHMTLLSAQKRTCFSTVQKGLSYESGLLSRFSVGVEPERNRRFRYGVERDCGLG